MFASANSDCGFGAIAMRKTVVDEDVIHEGVRPVAQIQSSRKQHGPDSIGDGTMGAFGLSNGTGIVGGSDFNFIFSIFDSAGDFVDVNGFLHGPAVSKKNAWTRPDINLGWCLSWRKCVNTASKDSKE